MCSIRQLCFYSASALLALQTAVLAIEGFCPSVCASITFRCFVETNAIVRFLASGRTILLVSGEVKFIRIFAGNHPQQGG